MVNEYRRTVTRLAVLMIVQFCLWFVLSTAYGIADGLVLSRFSPEICESLEQLLYVIIYAISFGIPILIGRKIIKKEERAAFPEGLPKLTVPMICASLGVIFAFAFLNEFVTRPLDSLGFDGFTPDITMTVTPLTFFAYFLSLVIVPALLEEILFRGVVLGALMPYGRTGAVAASALLFAVMHQNPKQFIYAFAAGVAMGYFVSESGSLMLGIVIHATNNFLSLVSTSVECACGDRIIEAFSLSLYFAVFVLALISLPVLIKKKSGADEKGEEKDKFPFMRHFFTPAMIIYFVLSAAYIAFAVMVFRGML